jgi:glycosyltransferase involved in cell wall biosynthesis
LIGLKRVIYIDNFLTQHGYAPTTGHTLVPLLQKEGFEVIPASNKKKRSLRLLHMLFTIAKHRKNAVVLIATYSTSAFYFAYSCSRLCRLLQIPYVPCLHGGNLPERIASSPQLVKRYFINSTMNVAVSGYLHQGLLTNGWKCIVIPNAISLSQYPFKLRTKVKLKLLWVRSFHKLYNPQMAIQVLYQLRQIHDNAMLTMVGPDKDGSLADCKNLVATLKLQEQVVFTGILTQKEWSELAAAHDIFINTTTADNLPVSVIEAMALGMIVISTKVGGVPFLIDDGVNGLLCNPNDTQDMVDRILRVYQYETLAQQLSTNAFNTSRQYGEAAVMSQWCNFLNTL